jgi:histidinol-phosphate phosphatase family protein
VKRRPAVFLDRDGTLIEDVPYIADPALVRLTMDAARAVRRLNTAGVPVVVITNQSGIARGRITPARYEQVRARLDELLRADGAHLDATYHCPHHPEVNGACECRKPARLLFDRAAAELSLDLSRSTFVGDRWRDIEPALFYGARGLLVPSRETPDEDLVRARQRAEVAPSLDEAVTRVLGLSASFDAR